MQPSNRALLWYFWRMSRKSIVLLSALCLAAAFPLWKGQVDDPGSSFAYANLIVQVFLITALGGCLFMWGTERSFVQAPFLLTLPLATRRYLFVFYVYVIAVVGAVSCAATALHLHLFGNVIQAEGPRVLLEFWQMPLLCVALACLIQSLFHLSGIKNEFRVVPMAIAMELLAFVCVLPVLDPGNLSGHRIESTALAALLFAWASSYNSLTAYRNGRQSGGFAALLERLDLGQGRTKAFSSPGSALFWLGWRRYGRVFPLWTLGLGMIGLAVIGCTVLFWHAINFQLIVLVYIVMLPVAGCAAFLCHVFLLVRTQEDLLGTGRGYFLALPVRSTAFARARLLAMALSVLTVTVAAAVLCLPLSFFGPVELRGDVIRVLLIAPLAVWLELWFGLAIAGGYAAFLLILGSMTLLLGGEPHLDYAVAGVALISIAATALFLFKGITRRLMSRFDLLLFAAALIPVAALIAFNTFGSKPVGHTIPIIFLQFGLFLPVALPFAAAPVLMHWIRHR